LTPIANLPGVIVSDGLAVVPPTTLMVNVIDEPPVQMRAFALQYKKGNFLAVTFLYKN
jgi:hypothetical protein